MFKSIKDVGIFLKVEREGGRKGREGRRVGEGVLIHEDRGNVLFDLFTCLILDDHEREKRRGG